MVRFKGASGTEWWYDATAHIGEPGGFGEVFRGHGQNGQAVAVKRVPLRWGHVGERRRREREVEITRILAQRSMEHVMPTIDLAHLDDDLLLVMPLARWSLAAALGTEALSQENCLQAVRQVAQGLVELAEASVLHRDLKPANVLEVEGHWKLADFGIARSLVEETGTYTFLGAGTYPHMAPELWNGQPATVKSDLYALGVIAYEAMTGGRPFNGPGEAEFRRQHMQEAPPPPSGLSAPLGRLILRLLSKNPAERPQDARAVVEGIDSALARLSTAQDNLRRAAFVAQQRRSAGEAQQAALEIEAGDAQARRVQGMADLAHILEDSADLIREALPEFTLEKFSTYWHLNYENFRLTVNLWIKSDLQPSVPSFFSHSGGPVIAGAIWNPHQKMPLGNIVCELQRDKIAWSLLRYRLLAGSLPYNRVPVSGVYGLDQEVFFREWQNLGLSKGRPRWPCDTTALTPGAVMALLRETLEGDLKLQ